MKKLFCLLGVHEYHLRDQELVQLWRGTQTNIVRTYSIRIYECRVCGHVKQIKVK